VVVWFCCSVLTCLFAGVTLTARNNRANPLFDEVFPVPSFAIRPVESSQLEVQLWCADEGNPVYVPLNHCTCSFSQFCLLSDGWM
jgi:hypothetical protein